VFLSKKETSNKRKIIPPSDDEEEPVSPVRKKIAVSTSKSSAPKPRPSIGKTKKHQADEDYDMVSPQHTEDDDDSFIEHDDIKPQKSKSKAPTKKPPVASSSKTKISTSNSANGTTLSQDAPKPNKSK
jgi:replication factor C subunit 1